MMYGDSLGDRLRIWLAPRLPHERAIRMLWRVQDHRLDRAMARQAAAAEALRKRDG